MRLNMRLKSALGSISPIYLRAVFTSSDPKMQKRQSNHQCLFVLFGSERAKAAHKMLMKLTHGSNPIK